MDVSREISTAKAYLQQARNRAIPYYYGSHEGADGARFTTRFPASAPTTPGSPTQVFCKDGKPQSTSGATWDHPTWKILDFKPAGPQLFAYTFTSSGQGVGARFTIRAQADLDCDGVLSTFEYTGVAQSETSISFGSGMRVENPHE